jgi:hypothetical protein
VAFACLFHSIASGVLSNGRLFVRNTKYRIPGRIIVSYRPAANDISAPGKTSDDDAAASDLSLRQSRVH